jgi:hypothetical protein
MLLLGKAWKIAAAIAAILTASRRVIQKQPALIGCAGGGRGDSAARCALERSAKLLNKASSGKKVPIEQYCAAMEALMPAFSAYGKMFENAARKDVQGNVDKLRSRAKALQRKEAGAMVLRERELDPAKTEAPDSAARALFWINKIVSQIAMSFEFLLDRPNASLTRCATDAYVKTCGPYNKMIHRNIAKVMLKIIPDRESFVQMYGAEDMAELAPTLRAWIKASKSSRRAVDEFFRRNPDLAPRRR